ncbi:hypothetical protein IV102_30020 [bacterium]|nr:hypothetical protein [bacterium]
MVRQRGFLMILVLMLCGILLTMGIGFLSTISSRYQSTAQAVLDVQAQALARAGLEEVRLKMNLDAQFPPRGALGQEIFRYSEPVLNPTGNVVGHYDISIDSSYLGTGCEVIILTASGRVVSPVDGQKTVATHTFRAYLDVYQPTSGPVNPTFWTLLRFDDLGVQ